MVGVAQGDSTPPINKQAALYSIKLLARRLAAGHREKFVKVGMTEDGCRLFLFEPRLSSDIISQLIIFSNATNSSQRPSSILYSLGFSHRVSLTLEREPSPSCACQQPAVHGRTMQCAWPPHDPSPPLTATPCVTTRGRGEDQVL